MNRIYVMLVFFYYTTKVGALAINLKYEMVLENITECDDPQPPYPPRKIVLFEFKMYKSKGKFLLSGRNTVTAEVPFQNFSLSGYNIDETGKKKRWFFVEKLSCRHFFGRTFLTFGFFQYDKTNCLLLRSSMSYKDIEIDQMFHKMPLQHAEGRFLWRSSMAADTRTVFCLDTTVAIKAVK